MSADHESKDASRPSAEVERETEAGAGPSGVEGQPGAVESTRPATHDMAMLFTCKVCFETGLLDEGF
jgi:hypothetical protein